MWALFNTALREIAREKGNLVHKHAGETILTKAELREMCDNRNDLVHRMGSFGADIPTTSMHWKQQARSLEWIVRQMSWQPPWTPHASRRFVDEHPTCHPRHVPRKRRTDANGHVEATQGDPSVKDLLDADGPHDDDMDDLSLIHI